MKWQLIACAALIVVAPAYAKRGKEKPVEEPPAPPAPTEVYENSDMRMGEQASEACLGETVTGETYDGRDGVYIVQTEEGAHAFLHFAEGCPFNAMMFAASATPRAAGGACLKPGDSIEFSDGYGGVTTCKVTQINVWRADLEALPDYDSES